MPNSSRQKRGRSKKKVAAKKRRRKNPKQKAATAPSVSSPAIAAAEEGTTNAAGLSVADMADVKKATAAAKRAATKAKKKAATEPVDTTNCIAAMTARNKEQAWTTKNQLLRSPPQRPTVADDAISVHSGDCVDVMYCLKPGTCDYGGQAWVEQTKVEGENLTLMAKVRYVHGGTAWVPASRITRILPFESAHGERSCRERARAAAAAAAAAPQKPPAVALPLFEALADGVRRRRPKGWRRIERIPRITDLKQRMNDKEKLICGAECRKLEAHLATIAAAPPQQYVRGARAGQFKKVAKNPLTKKNLADAWGVGRSTLDGYAKARLR